MEIYCDASGRGLIAVLAEGKSTVLRTRRSGRYFINVLEADAINLAIRTYGIENNIFYSDNLWAIREVKRNNPTIMLEYIKSKRNPADKVMR